jgi:hypothetical protein
MELIGEEIVAVDIEDKMACQKAYELSLESKPILPVPYQDPLFLDELSTTRVVKGLVKVSLEEPDYDCHGLSPLEASLRLLELYGIEEMARISLQTPDYIHRGLGQPEASKIIDRLCGTIESPEVFLTPR